jgi:uncharacterized membrane protein
MPLTELVRLFSLLDLVAVSFFGLCYFGTGWVIEHPGRRRRSVTVMMVEVRHQWMRELAKRDQRIFDSQIIANLRTATSFFASTTILAIGGVLAVAGNSETLRSFAGGLLTQSRPIEVHQIKLFLVALLLVAAFLRFVWANRVFGYCSVVMAAVPPPGDLTAYRVARQAADLNVRAAFNFNRGLRAVYFGLAAVAWMIGPLPLAVATLGTVWTLWQREFASDPHRILTEKEETE